MKSIYEGGQKQIFVKKIFPFLSNTGQWQVHFENVHNLVLYILARNKTVLSRLWSIHPIEMMFSDMKSYINKQMCANIDEVRAAIALYRMNLSNQKIASFIHHLHQEI